MSIAMTILPSRFFSDRGGIPIRYIVLHTTEGTDSRTWLTETGGVSANYLVQRSTIYQLVNEDNAAWHAGRIIGTPTTPLYDGTNPNFESIGIEMEGSADHLLDGATLRATADLIRDIRARRGPLPLVSHSELSPGDRHDPGAQNRTALEALLEEDDMAFKDDPDAKAYVANVRETLNAMKQVYDPLVGGYADLKARIATLEGRPALNAQEQTELDAIRAALNTAGAALAKV